MERPIGIDLFAGAGGMSLGFEQAGFDVAAAVEIDPIHASVHSFNFPQTKVLARSVIGLSGDEIRQAAGIEGADVNVVFGGAPCQGFSMIGHRQLDDPRNQLVSEFVRIVGELDADYAVFENVKGLTVGRHRVLLDEIVAAFQRMNYEVLLPWQVLNAVHFGVPQSRERLFLIAAKRGKPLPTYPTRTTVEPGATMVEDTTRVPTCEEALGDLPDAEEYIELVDGDAVSVVRWGDPSQYARQLRCMKNDAWHLGYMRQWNPELLTSSRRTDHTEISRGRFTATKQGTVEPISRFFRLSANGVSNTLRAGTDSARGAFTSPRPIHYQYARCITVREMMRLHGYPDWFRMHTTKWHGARQVGNSVPPPLAKAVAQQVMAAGGYPKLKPVDILPLGKPELLNFEMSEAAKFFAVEKIIGRRDRKSGAKKRRQSEIEAKVAAE